MTREASFVVSLLLLLFFAAVSSASASAVATHWKAVARAPPSATVPLLFALRQRNISELMRIADAVSDPLSKSYGRYLSLEELHSLVGDAAAAEGAVAWLRAHGFSSIVLYPHAGFVSAEHSAGHLQELFSARVFAFEHLLEENGRHLLRAHEHTIPEDLAQFVEAVFGLSDFPLVSTISPFVVAFDDDNETMAPQSEPEEITPTVLRKWYGLGELADTVVADKRSTQSLFEALEQYYSPKDLDLFQSRFGLHRNDIARVVGKNEPEVCEISPRHCAEGELDVEYVMAIAQDAPTTYWSMSGVSSDLFHQWILAVGEDADPPFVHSISYGGPELYFPKDMILRVDVEFAKLAARGVTVVVASGDDGVAGPQARSTSQMCRYSPSFPAALPHAVSVGATQGPEANKEEVVCSSETGGLITGGGGFSTVFGMPDFQATAVKGFLERADPKPADGFNAGGRGFPDVSLAGRNYAVAIGGRWYALSGTSASAPVFAAMLTLINGQRLKQNKPALGWVTPALYSLGMGSPAFNDVVRGRNNCCAGRQSPVCCKEGFSAAKGWDPASGWGSVNFPKLAEALINL